MVLQLKEMDESMSTETNHQILANDPAQTRDAVRSKAWRQRQKSYLTALIHAAGAEPEDTSVASCMAQLKGLFAEQWKQVLAEAPVAVMRHDPRLTRQERRRISSVKNNRLCRQRHNLFVAKVENALTERGVPTEKLVEFKGLR